jgi:hypothetical protein
MACSSAGAHRLASLGGATRTTNERYLVYQQTSERFLSSAFALAPTVLLASEMVRIAPVRQRSDVTAVL